MDYDQLCSKIIESDSNVRFASVFNTSCKHIAGGIRPGVNAYLTKKETETSVMEAIKRWHSRMTLIPRIGIPEWSLTKYGKLFRITMPVGPNELLLVSADSSVNPLNLIDKLTGLIYHFEDIIKNKHSSTNKLTS